MATINIDNLKQNFGASVPPLGGTIPQLASWFGMPTCVMSIGVAALRALPFDFLNGLTKTTQDSKNEAKNAVRRNMQKVFYDSGLMELITGTGKYKYISDSSKNKLEDDEVSFFEQIVNTVGIVTGAVEGVIDGVSEFAGELESLLGCMEDIMGFFGSVDGGGNKQLATRSSDGGGEAALALAKMQVSGALSFIEKADVLLANIALVLDERAKGISEEPYINEIFDINDDLAFWVSSNLPVSPIEDDQLLEVFDLVFGPPKSKKGQFLLSVDGLYYDVQEGGVPFFDIDKTEFIPSALIPDVSSGEMWEFKYNPNLGGKGVIFTKKDLGTFTHTLFDIDTVDNSLHITLEYDSDHFLQVIKGQKNKHINDVENEINNLIDSGYDSDGAVVRNMRQNLLSIASNYDNKINKRKKQIEVAFKAQGQFGEENTTYSRGEVPLNDFSFLQKYHLAPTREEQERLMFRQGEVSGVVLPLQNNFVVATEDEGSVSLDHLLVPPIGTGDILDTENFEEGIGTSISNLTTSMNTESLIGVYNFLDSTAGNASGNYTSLNCANIAPPSGANFLDVYGNARLVYDTNHPMSEVFTRGLSIPYLRGLRRFSAADGSPISVGSYLELPNIPQFQDFTYLTEGFSFELWTHIPDYSTERLNPYANTGWGASSYNKIILGNENIGGDVPQPLDEDRFAAVDFTAVRGLLIGFSRDRQVAHDQLPSNNTEDNTLENNSVFFIAPTQAVNGSSVAFTQFVEDGDYFSDTPKIHKSVVDTSTTIPSFDGRGDISFSDVENEFIHIGISVLPKENKVTILLDGNEIKTSTIDRVFGVNQWESPNLPTITKNNSFSYSQYGPSINVGSNEAFTPWIVGGGFTDGYDTFESVEVPPGEGNFMGKYHGIGSGLNGNIGSLKFYTKALTNNEIQQNYIQQKGYFKNIDLS